jgi:hypothetical protein
VLQQPFGMPSELCGGDAHARKYATKRYDEPGLKALSALQRRCAWAASIPHSCRHAGFGACAPRG